MTDYEPDLPSSQQTGLTDSTHTSTSSRSSRYGLSEDDDTPVLVYEYRGDVKTVPQKELADRINKDHSKRVTRKRIPRGASTLDLYGSDLFLPSEKEEKKHKAMYCLNLASVPVPWYVYWRRLVNSGFDELYIVSHESSPEGSEYDSDSRKPSPASTWKSEDTQLGASA